MELQRKPKQKQNPSTGSVFYQALRKGIRDHEISRHNEKSAAKKGIKP